MVKGLDVFKRYFADFSRNYVIIGGVACHVAEEELGFNPRVTKDIDMVLVIEALSEAFVRKFWDFVVTGGYFDREKGLSREDNEYYRFKNPSDKSFPKQVELFSRKLNLMNFHEEAHLTPIPAGEDVSSLSAILMDEDYYHFTLKQSREIDDVHYASPASLIALKAKAFLDMTRRQNEGADIDSGEILKHKKDVFRLIALIPSGQIALAPDKIVEDIHRFIDAVREDLPGRELFRAMGAPRLDGKSMLEHLEKLFQRE